jgi:acylglycerol lipase
MSALDTVSAYLSYHKMHIAVALAAAYVFNKLSKLRGATHSSDVLQPPHAKIFPNYFQNADGLWVYTRVWHAYNYNNAKNSKNSTGNKLNPNCRAIAFIVHGAGEHCNRYEHMARLLNSLGITVYSMDHIGCGLSQGDRMHIQHFNHYIRDYTQFVGIIQREYNENGVKLPCFLIGHSMGGLIALQLLRTVQPTPNITSNNSANRNESLISPTQSSGLWLFDGAIISSPAIVADPKTLTPLNIFLAKVFSNLLPKFGIDSLDSRAISRIPQVVQQYCADVLNYHGVMRARWGFEILGHISEIQNNLQQINLPLLVIQGTEDKLCNRKGAEMLFEQATGKDKTLKMYQGAYHETFNDLCSDEVFTDVKQWLTQHLQ